MFCFGGSWVWVKLEVFAVLDIIFAIVGLRPFIHELLLVAEPTSGRVRTSHDMFSIMETPLSSEYSSNPFPARVDLY